MPSTRPFQQLGLHGFRVKGAIIPLTLGVVLLMAGGKKAQAQFQAPAVRVIPPAPTTHIIGSPIPSAVPLVPGTNTPYSLSPYGSQNPYNPYSSGYYGSPVRVITPGYRVIRNSTLVSPTLINPTITDSVLVDPVIINSPGFHRRGFGTPAVIYSPRGFGFYSSPRSGVRVRIGY